MSLEIQEKVLEPDDLETAATYHNLAVLLQSRDKLVEAEPLFLKALTIRDKELGPEHPDTATSYHNLEATRSFYLAERLQHSGMRVEAERFYRKGLEIMQALQPSAIL